MKASQSTTYRDVCYAVFRDQELPHPAAPKLLQAVAQAGYSSSGAVELDADLSNEDGAWLQSKLREIGFEEEGGGGSLRADPELVQLLVKRGGGGGSQPRMCRKKILHEERC